MRILALTNLFPSPWHPHRAPFNRWQLAALAAEHEVRVIAPVAWTGKWPRRDTGGPGELHRNNRLWGGMIIEHPTYVYTPKVLRGWYGHFFEKSIRPSFHAASRELKPDVVLGCWAYPDGWAAVRLAREAGLPVVIKAHGSDLLTLRSAGRRARAAEALAGADAVITVSRHLRDAAVGLGAHPARTHTVYNGIDARLFNPGPRAAALARLGLGTGEPLVLFIGNLLPVKGPDVLIDALAMVARSARRFRCLCIGAGPMRPDLQARIASLGLTNRVHLLGPRPQSELPDWYRAAELLVLPSRSEGIPNVLLEAAACGTPFIASRVGGVPEFARHDSLVPAGDADALAAKIQLFLDPATRPAAAPPHSPGSWHDSARALADVLRDVVRTASPISAAA